MKQNFSLNNGGSNRIHVHEQKQLGYKASLN
jgi:hypothetical protein